MGYTGQASFGQNAFAALGGYGTAILCAGQGWQPIVALPVTMVISGSIAIIVGYPTLRLRGHYLAMATFALGLITYELSVEWIGLTQGYMGYAGIPPLGIGKYELSSDRRQLVVLVVVLLLGVWIANRLRDSRFGRALRAIAGSEAAANALGIDIARYKLAAFVVAAIYASVAGSLFAHFIGFISPEVFGLSMVTLSFTMLYLGGIGTTWGPIIGAVIVSMLPEAFRGLKELQDIAYAAVLILILIFFPKGLAALPGMLWRRRREPKAEGTP
jgi:branched-chain amino acid transport system permease protein